MKKSRCKPSYQNYKNKTKQNKTKQNKTKQRIYKIMSCIQQDVMLYMLTRLCNKQNGLDRL